VKCDKCGYISFDFNHICPSCQKDITSTRRKLGLYYEEPEVNFEDYFTGGSSLYKTAPAVRRDEAELEIDSADEFEFTLDD
jgi:hypothetical protein